MQTVYVMKWRCKRKKDDWSYKLQYGDWSDASYPSVYKENLYLSHSGELVEIQHINEIAYWFTKKELKENFQDNGDTWSYFEPVKATLTLAF